MAQLGLGLFEEKFINLSGKKVLLGISGGINSAALLCYLLSEYPNEYKPAELHLYAIQLKEHSPDTFPFMKDCIRYAIKNFINVRWTVRWGSVLKFFEGENMIPHPILSPCSDHLKIIPMMEYTKKHNIDFDLVGFVRSERTRIERQNDRAPEYKRHPIAHLSNEDCFTLVRREIGWYPAIYDIHENGKPVFRHNNCLPCKNMNGYADATTATKNFESVQLYYPEMYAAAIKTSEKINGYWGRLPKDESCDIEDFGECQVCEFL